MRKNDAFFEPNPEKFATFSDLCVKHFFRAAIEIVSDLFWVARKKTDTRVRVLLIQFLDTMMARESGSDNLEFLFLGTDKQRKKAKRTRTT